MYPDMQVLLDARAAPPSGQIIIEIHATWIACN